MTHKPSQSAARWVERPRNPPSNPGRHYSAAGGPALLLLALLISAGCDTAPTPFGDRAVAGDPETGHDVILAIGCGACHVIPGVPGARGTVGPSLAGFARRDYIAGVAPNRPALLIEWVRDAPSIAPQTAMPDLPLTETEAQDVAAYLYTLR